MIFDNRWISDNDGVIGDIKIYERIRGNQNIVAYNNLPYYDSAGTDKHPVTDLRTTRFFTSIHLADIHYMTESAIIPKFRQTIYNHGTSVADIKPFPYPGIGWYLKPIFVTVVE